MKKFKFILWDVDNTLLDFDKSEDYAIRYSFEQFGRKIDTRTVRLYSAINDSYWKRLERGEITKEKVLSGRFESLFEEMQIYDENFASLWCYFAQYGEKGKGYHLYAENYKEERRK